MVAETAQALAPPPPSCPQTKQGLHISCLCNLNSRFQFSEKHKHIMLVWN